MNKLTDFKVAVLATDAFEQWELKAPVKALKKAGATVHVLSHKMDEIATDGTLEDSDPNAYDALVLPADALNDAWLQMDPEVRRFVQIFDEEKKPMTAVHHAA